MNRKIAQIAARRNLLIAKVASQRDEFAAAYVPIQTTLGYVDYGIKVVHSVSRHPLIAGGVAAVLVILAPKRWKMLLIENMLPAGILLLRKYLVKK